MKQITISIGILLGFLLTIATTPASAFGFAAVSVQYNSNSKVRRIPVTHVYPNGESLIYQNGGERVYSTGYGGPSTCYVSCWHNGVNPNQGSGSHFSIGIGAHKTW